MTKQSSGSSVTGKPNPMSSVGWVAVLAVTFLLPAITLCGCTAKRAVAPAVTPQVLHVQIALSVAKEVPASLVETGGFIAEEASNIAPAVSGLVIRTPVSVGDFVREGQVLCELDHKDAQLKLQESAAQLEEAMAAVRQAESRIGLGQSQFNPATVPEVAAARASFESSSAQARLATADARRYANLVATGDVSQSVYDKQRTQAESAQAQANAAHEQYQAALNIARQSYQAIGSSQASLDAMRAQVGIARKALSDTTLRAPFSGYISARPVAVGEFVTTSTSVVTLVQVGTLKLQLSVPEQDAAGLRVGMPVVARVAAFPGRDFKGTTSALNPAVNPDSRSLMLEAQFANGDGLLRPGMFTTAHVLLPRVERAVYVPAGAVTRDRTTDSSQVYVIADGKAHLQVVAVENAGNGLERVLSGLTGGEQVATSPQTALYDGAPVDVTNGR